VTWPPYMPLNEDWNPPKHQPTEATEQATREKLLAMHDGSPRESRASFNLNHGSAREGGEGNRLMR